MLATVPGVRDAVVYKNAYIKDLKNRRKKGTLSTDEEKKNFNDQFDFHRMTEQDEAVCEEIFKTIE